MSVCLNRESVRARVERHGIDGDIAGKKQRSYIGSIECGRVSGHDWRHPSVPINTLIPVARLWARIPDGIHSECRSSQGNDQQEGAESRGKESVMFYCGLGHGLLAFAFSMWCSHGGAILDD